MDNESPFFFHSTRSPIMTREELATLANERVERHRRELEAARIQTTYAQPSLPKEEENELELDPKTYFVDGDLAPIEFQRNDGTKDYIIFKKVGVRERAFWTRLDHHNLSYYDSQIEIKSTEYSCSLDTMPGCCGVALIHSSDSSFRRYFPKEARDKILQLLSKRYSSVVLYTNYSTPIDANWTVMDLGINPKSYNRLYCHTYVFK